MLRSPKNPNKEIRMISRRNWLKTGAAAGVASIAASASSTASAASGAADTYDVVILGAGTGGLVTAIESFDLGLKPVVLEKMDWAAGNSLYASGGVAAWGTEQQEREGHPESREAFEADMMKVSEYQADPELVKTYCDNIREGVKWLVGPMGVKFTKIRRKPWPLNYRMLNVDGEGLTGGGRLVRDLLAQCEKRGIPVLFNTKAVELIQDDSCRVAGVKCETEKGFKNFMANDGVVIATGGFSANREMLNRYMGGPLSRLALRGSPFVTGENIKLSEKVGAQLVHMDQFHCGPIVAATHTNPNFVIDAGQGIDVNPKGERFMDEAFTYTQKSMAAATQTPNNYAYHVIDEHWATSSKAAKRFLGMNSPVHIANTIEELAQKMGADPKTLKATVDEYNKAFAEGRLKELTPPCNLAHPEPLNKPPFYAFPFQGGITATFGGPKINTKAQVMSTERRPIRGLYAVGNAAGGLFYGNYIGGSQLGGAVVFGRIAAADMASKHKKA